MPTVSQPAVKRMKMDDNCVQTEGSLKDIVSPCAGGSKMPREVYLR